MENKTLKFINKAKLKHGDEYDYSLTEYIDSRTKVKIICKTHGVFEQTPHHHISRKQGCNKCSYNKISENTRKNNHVFINEAKTKHGDKYDYSLVDYINSKTKVKIICPIHGVFEQTPDNHLKGQICGKCSGLFKTTDEFILDSKKIHGNKYDYSISEFKNVKTKIKIICPIHGVFEQLPNAHTKLKQGCPKCIGRNKTNDDFILDSKTKHGDKYDYSLVDYINSKTKVKIICPIHGVFEQTPNMHLRGNGCPICKESKGEKKIREYLVKHNVVFNQQFSFINCKNVQVLPFDFYLPEYNTCIEYDGIQHFKPINRFGGENGFLKVKHNDSIKTKFCFDNNIKLLRIAYYEDVLESLNIFFTK
jgi:serine protease inhibitor ecotin